MLNNRARARSKNPHGRRPLAAPTSQSELSPSGKSKKSDIQSPNRKSGSKHKHVRARKTSSHERTKLSSMERDKKRERKKGKTKFSSEQEQHSREQNSREQLSKESDYDKVPEEKVMEYEKKYRDYDRVKEEKKEEKKELRQSQIGSVFEPIMGPMLPARSGANGVKNKMKWKIDVDPVELKGDQKMPEILEKLRELRKGSGMKACKVLRANEQQMSCSDDEPTEEVIHLSARLLQLVKMEPLITKEVSKEDQELLKGYCRCGDHKDKVEPIFEAITLSILDKVATKNEFIRHVSIPGQLRMFAVDEKKSKLPMLALMIIRKDLFYYAWTRQPPPDDDEQLDPTWNSMTYKIYVTPAFNFPQASAGQIKSAHFQTYY
ncbi:hypothetical protein CAEBREN_20802 [Caenorhabditis brenneri]|uniref:Uncharacterized protein n=1 Tax=Caenorhabditis brenneri TaxID=135651 RepID=G0NH99_CAEBE|nr:hypothetical protein CAEBREN_20802 [Caenorhabditis brenneri]